MPRRKPVPNRLLALRGRRRRRVRRLSRPRRCLHVVQAVEERERDDLVVIWHGCAESECREPVGQFGDLIAELGPQGGLSGPALADVCGGLSSLVTWARGLSGRRLPTAAGACRSCR